MLLKDVFWLQQIRLETNKSCDLKTLSYPWNLSNMYLAEKEIVKCLEMNDMKLILKCVGNIYNGM